MTGYIVMQVVNSSLDAIIFLLIPDTMRIPENGIPVEVPVIYTDFYRATNNAG